MNDTAKLGLLLPAILNPATAAAVGIGLAFLWVMREDEDEAVGDTVLAKCPQPADRTVVKQLPTIDAQIHEIVTEESETPPASSSEIDRNEMIRKAMSELGKRSAAARAKKKAERQEQA